MSRLRIVLALAAAGAVGWAMLHSARTVPVARSAAADAPEWRGRFPNIPLRTHDGRTVRFYDDLVRGKIVTINFMYVECEGTCPGTTSTLVEVQKQLGDRVGRDIAMLSITLQPEADTPERLADYARRYGARPGMTFLTGRPGDIDRLRRALGFSDERNLEADGDRRQHLGIVRIGNEPLDWWAAAPSVSGAGQIVALLKSMDAPGRDKAPLESPEGPPTAAALGVPVSIPDTAGEGGAWGMAVLAAYLLREDARQSLPDYLDARIASRIGTPVHPDPEDVKGFSEFFARHTKGLAIEREAVKALG